MVGADAGVGCAELLVGAGRGSLGVARGRRPLAAATGRVVLRSEQLLFISHHGPSVRAGEVHAAPSPAAPSPAAPAPGAPRPCGPPRLDPSARLDPPLQLAGPSADEEGANRALDGPADEHAEHAPEVDLDRVGHARSVLAEVLELPATVD